MFSLISSVVFSVIFSVIALAGFHVDLIHDHTDDLAVGHLELGFDLLRKFIADLAGCDDQSDSVALS